MKHGVFIERDGVLNQAAIKGRREVSPRAFREFNLKVEVVPLLNELKAAGLVLIVTTNQPGLSCGSLLLRELDRMHELLCETFPIDDILVCPHGELDRCTCRKPKPGLLIEGARKWDLNLSRSFLISNKWQDAEAAQKAGVTSLLLDSPWLGEMHHDFVFPDLAILIEKVLQLSTPKSIALV